MVPILHLWHEILVPSCVCIHKSQKYIFCQFLSRSQSGDYPLKYLPKFGYKPNMNLNILKRPFLYFWVSYLHHVQKSYFFKKKLLYLLIFKKTKKKKKKKKKNFILNTILLCFCVILLEPSM
jgi:hypothetical protein